MNDLVLNIVTPLLTLSGAFALIYFFVKDKSLFDFEKKQKEGQEMFEKSQKDAIAIKEDLEQKMKFMKENIAKDEQRRSQRIEKLKESLSHKEDTLFKKEDRINEYRLRIAKTKEEIQSREGQIERSGKDFIEKLSEKTGLSVTQSKTDILERYARELAEENKERIKKIEESLKENAVKTARKILINVMQRLCSPTSVETKAVLIKVPKDNIKGKIVGREGKNIQEFESLLTVDVIFNDLPNTISLSAFNLVNRRIAQVAMEKLIKIKHEIDATVVKRAVSEAEKEVDKELFDIGQNVIEKLGMTKLNLDKELIRTIGRLQFRTSYGQNIMKHSMEVAWVATMLGFELGLDAKVCKIGGFLHDLGKAIDQNPDVQGAHDFLTKELMEKYGFSEEEIHAAWTHHDSAPQKTPEALLVKAADAVSAGRPGARQESLEKYLERIRALEETVRSFDGVKTSYAISAGREVRVVVDSEKIDDIGLQTLAKNAAAKIEKELSYPGKIKVNAIRRTDHLDIAK